MFREGSTFEKLINAMHWQVSLNSCIQFLCNLNLDCVTCDHLFRENLLGEDYFHPGQRVGLDDALCHLEYKSFRMYIIKSKYSLLISYYSKKQAFKHWCGKLKTYLHSQSSRYKFCDGMCLIAMKVNGNQ